MCFLNLKHQAYIQEPLWLKGYSIQQLEKAGSLNTNQSAKGIPCCPDKVRGKPWSWKGAGVCLTTGQPSDTFGHLPFKLQRHGMGSKGESQLTPQLRLPRGNCATNWSPIRCFFNFFIQFGKVTFHLQLLPNIGYFPRVVQYILEPLLHPILCTGNH